jgi:Dihydroprymidine dehydrogenase domain II, 4Fe-4S cluster
MAVQRMLKFVSLAKEMPEKRPANLRAEDFHEIYRQFAAEKAAEQASRCSQCGVPYCQTHCPLHNNIPDWLRLTAEGRLQEAYELSQATNTFPEICGRICPQDRLCEGNCVIEQSGRLVREISDRPGLAERLDQADPAPCRADGIGGHNRRGARRACGGRCAAPPGRAGHRL